MESVNRSETGNSPRVLPVVTLGESEHSHGRKSSSSLSSSSSSSGVVLGLEPDDVTKIEALEYEKDARLASDSIDDEFRGSSMPLYEPHSSDSSPTQSPPAQVMERTTDSPSSASYRIPSSVFARTKSTAPMEWSVTSNESLFSIQMGNMSFTKDYDWITKSGELNYQVDSNFSSPVSGSLIDMSKNQLTTPSKQSSKYKSAELGKKNAVAVDARFSVTESKAAETMREVIRENEDNRCKEKTHKSGCNSPSLTRSSDASGASTQSFAFPILTGDDKSTSRHTRSRPNSQPQTPKVAQQTQPEPNSQAHQQQSQTPKAETAPNKSQSFFHGKWFSCFPCCPTCT